MQELVGLRVQGIEYGKSIYGTPIAHGMGGGKVVVCVMVVGGGGSGEGGGEGGGADPLPLKGTLQGFGRVTLEGLPFKRALEGGLKGP